jgi:hypothetical protein
VLVTFKELVERMCSAVVRMPFRVVINLTTTNLGETTNSSAHLPIPNENRDESKTGLISIVWAVTFLLTSQRSNTSPYTQVPNSASRTR